MFSICLGEHPIVSCWEMEENLFSLGGLVYIIVQIFNILAPFILGLNFKTPSEKERKWYTLIAYLHTSFFGAWIQLAKAFLLDSQFNFETHGKRVFIYCFLAIMNLIIHGIYIPVAEVSD